MEHISKHIRRCMETFLKHIVFAYMYFQFCHFVKGWAPKHPEYPSNEIQKISDMRPISVKEHEWLFANIIPIFITKHTRSNFIVWGI